MYRVKIRGNRYIVSADDPFTAMGKAADAFIKNQDTTINKFDKISVKWTSDEVLDAPTS